MVCATHQDLRKKYQMELLELIYYYRINVFPINVPTLSERNEDIPILMEIYAK